MACIIADCGNPADLNLGVRLRRSGGTAIWAPNTDAMVCDTHAVQGFQIEITLVPTTSNRIETVVHSRVGVGVRRSTPIAHTP